MSSLYPVSGPDMTKFSRCFDLPVGVSDIACLLTPAYDAATVCRNKADGYNLGLNDPTIIGSPIIGNGYTRFQGNANYLSTGFTETRSWGLAALVRFPDLSGSVGGCYQSNVSPTGFGLACISSTQVQVRTAVWSISFRGSISGSVLTVTSFDAGSSGSLTAGQVLDNAALPGLTISSQLTGTTGGVGTYQLSASAPYSGSEPIGTGTPVAIHKEITLSNLDTAWRFLTASHRNGIDITVADHSNNVVTTVTEPRAQARNTQGAIIRVGSSIVTTSGLTELAWWALGTAGWSATQRAAVYALGKAFASRPDLGISTSGWA